MGYIKGPERLQPDPGWPGRLGNSFPGLTYTANVSCPKPCANLIFFE